MHSAVWGQARAAGQLLHLPPAAPVAAVAAAAAALRGCQAPDPADKTEDQVSEGKLIRCPDNKWMVVEVPTELAISRCVKFAEWAHMAQHRFDGKQPLMLQS